MMVHIYSFFHPTANYCEDVKLQAVIPLVKNTFQDQAALSLNS